MTEEQTQILKLALAAKGVPDPLADLIVDVIDSSHAALAAYTQKAQAETVKCYVETATMLMALPGFEKVADKLLHAVVAMTDTGASDAGEGDTE